jgi:hypothetical protein
MAKRKAGSQTASLTPDHKKSGIDLIYLAAGGVPHIVGKLSMKATTLLAKLWGYKVAGVPFGTISGLPLGNPGRKKPFECNLHGQPQSIL